MNVIVVKAKVLLQSEEMMEAAEKYESLQDDPSTKRSVWRRVSIPYEDIYRIIEFNENKCIIMFKETDTNLLVAEKFDSLNSKWEELREKYGFYLIEEEGENNEVDETTSDEEDD